MRSTDEPVVRRPPRRRTAYRLRVDLLAHPHEDIWREFEVPSDIRLDELHRVLQVVMGWTDAHLHRFSITLRPQSGVRFVAVDDHETVGIPERDIRLDQVIYRTDHVLHYLYDFGDDWLHVIRLTSVEPMNGAVGLPRCLAGELACPPENCGGAAGYAEVVRAADAVLAGGPSQDWARERAGWLLRGVVLPEDAAALTAFDAAEANTALRAMHP